MCFQGVRDLLKAFVDKIQTIPTTVSSAVVQELLAAREVQNFNVVHFLKITQNQSVFFHNVFHCVYSRWWSISWTETPASCQPILLSQKSGNCTQRDSFHTGLAWVFYSSASLKFTINMTFLITSLRNQTILYI